MIVRSGLFRIIALAAVIGFAMAACDIGSTGGGKSYSGVVVEIPHSGSKSFDSIFTGEVLDSIDDFAVFSQGDMADRITQAVNYGTVIGGEQGSLSYINDFLDGIETGGYINFTQKALILSDLNIKGYCVAGKRIDTGTVGIIAVSEAMP